MPFGIYFKPRRKKYKKTKRIDYRTRAGKSVKNLPNNFGAKLPKNFLDF